MTNWLSAFSILFYLPLPPFFIYQQSLVKGRSSRTWSNQDKALETLESNGIEHAIIYDTVPKTLAQLEKILGKAKFTELVGSFVIKPQGKPTLVLESDKRTEFNSAVVDFANVIN